MKTQQVKKCIHINCNNPAIDFTGHCHDGKEIIDTGFCEEHKFRSYNPRPDIRPIKGCSMQTGCFGNYKKKYGKEFASV
ncbi:MAG: hypothetical protein M0R17_01610 [Candidatus Omnitrophica bacterium]|jgi:hypothetical protein|nr:hypothetical protein [Candidatus Omnitrophota bacterium]